jgi:hypothetical protein
VHATDRELTRCVRTLGDVLSCRRRARLPPRCNTDVTRSCRGLPSPRGDLRDQADRRCHLRIPACRAVLVAPWCASDCFAIPAPAPWRGRWRSVAIGLCGLVARPLAVRSGVGVEGARRVRARRVRVSPSARARSRRADVADRICDSDPVRGLVRQRKPPLHTLVAEGVWYRAPDGSVRFHALPPPTDEDVEQVTSPAGTVADSTPGSRCRWRRPRRRCASTTPPRSRCNTSCRCPTSSWNWSRRSCGPVRCRPRIRRTSSVCWELPGRSFGRTFSHLAIVESIERSASSSACC